ncbi:uncharacterized protein LOC129595636 [Paramacrobiotus metropolitanus]|uniref:uncharacterized protein LOC129595636 n=1 Tax=Paramacrobiotus metropolitanus TaxID=2943436 RepID=UPI0024456DBA|nr:uncharacterized protein LOC129595636 [Paramacrobiotus metropolitanus]
MIQIFVCALIGITLFCCTVIAQLPQRTCLSDWSWSVKGQWDYGVICRYTPITQFLADYSSNPNAIPDNVIRIIIKCPGPPFVEKWANRTERVYCNRLRTDHASLPFRNQLAWVSLTGFTGEGEQRPPIRQFLQHVHSTIQVLSIRFSRIGYVDADFFNAYKKLAYLDLSDNDIYDIAPDTFLSVEFANGDSPFSYREINLAGNALQETDLDVFKPLRLWVQWLTLSKQNPPLRKIFVSGSPYQLLSLRRINLDENRITAIPAEVTQCFPHLEFVDLRSNTLCAVDECTCCGIQSFLKWVASASSTPVTGNATTFHFRCGATNYTNDAAFPVRNLQPTINSAILKLQSTCTKCKGPETLEIRCTRAVLWDVRLRSTDALVIRFTSGTHVHCPTTLHELYEHVLETVNGPGSQPQYKLSRAAMLYCRDDQPVVLGPDPDLSEHTSWLRLTLDIDLSPYCYDLRTRLLEYIETNFAGDERSITVTPSLPAGVPVKTWMSEYLTCPVDNVVSVNCTAGQLFLPNDRLNATTSMVVSVRGDTTFRCREIVIKLHRYLISAEGSSVAYDADYSASEEAIVAVCQRGRIVLSEANPVLSTKLQLTYYSAPNDPCRKIYQAFLNYVQEQAN